MEKKTYAKPALGIETFIPNAYCKVCFDLHCSVPQPITGDPNMLAVGTDTGGLRHKKNKDGSGCGWDENQVIRIDDGNNVSVVEVHVPEHSGEYVCTFTFPPGLTVEWLNNNHDQRIEWKTTVDGNTYQHYGYAVWPEGTTTYNANHS